MKEQPPVVMPNLCWGRLNETRGSPSQAPASPALLIQIETTLHKIRYVIVTPLWPVRSGRTADGRAAAGGHALLLQLAEYGLPFLLAADQPACAARTESGENGQHSDDNNDAGIQPRVLHLIGICCAHLLLQASDLGLI